MTYWQSGAYLVLLANKHQIGDLHFDVHLTVLSERTPNRDLLKKLPKAELTLRTGLRIGKLVFIFFT